MTEMAVGEPQDASGTVASSKEKRKLDYLCGEEVDDGRLGDFYMIVTIQTHVKLPVDEREQATSSMVKVLDIKRILHGISSMEPAERTGISLDGYVVNPIPGMELVDVSSIPLSEDIGLPKRFPILQTHGAKVASRSIRVRPHHGSEYKDYEGFIGGVSLALPDGTIAAFFSNSPNMADAVGIVEENDQVLLSYPAVGCGELAVFDKHGNHDKYMACCLRAGTCYLIPLGKMRSDSGNAEEKGDDYSIISVVQFPQDIDSDLQNVYVQAFTAGNLMLGSNGDLHPVLVYSWSGGVIDVYSCGLVPYSGCDWHETLVENENNCDKAFVSRTERRALEDMIDNESLSLLSQILMELRKESNHPLFEGDEWTKVTQEVSPIDALRTGRLDLDGLCSDSYLQLRSLLLSLADSTE